MIAEAHSVAHEVRASFAHLSTEQLNWKPSARQWSVGECLAHLVTANSTYFPVFDKLVSGKEETTLWERVPLVPGLFGRMLVSALSPQSTRKMKAPQVFLPGSGAVDRKIVADLIGQQSRLAEYMKESEKLDLMSTIMSSPASGLVTYRLSDAYRIILVHEKRHIVQAQNVMTSEGFPELP